MDDVPSIRGPGEVVLLQRAACLHIKYEIEQGGKGSASKGGTDFLQCPNECDDLGCPQAILLPTCPDFASLSFSRTSCVACTRLENLERAWQAKARSGLRP